MYVSSLWALKPYIGKLNISIASCRVTGSQKIGQRVQLTKTMGDISYYYLQCIPYPFMYSLYNCQVELQLDTEESTLNLDRAQCFWTDTYS